MLLAIDAGNTDTVFAIFEGHELKGKWRLSSSQRHTSDEYALALLQLMERGGLSAKDITDTIISCVVPKNLFALKTLSRQYFYCEPLVVGEDILEFPIGIKMDTPSEVGADRLVNAVAAHTLYEGASIIIDFGTATTFDVVDERGNYCGGAIAPGIELSLEALHAAAAKLPEIAVEKPEHVIGKSTVAAMQSGIYWGYIGLLEGIISRIKGEHGHDMHVIATGGLAPLFINGTKAIPHLEEDLTIQGLQRIYTLNEEKQTKAA